jgi:hypothetical protein
MSKDTFTFTANVKSTPWAKEPPGADVFYAALGRVYFLWGRFETHLQMTILGIWNLPEATALNDKFKNEIPVSMKKRAKFWRVAFRELPRLQRYQEAANKLMDEAMEGARRRSILLHSSWGDFESTDPWTAMVTIHRHRGDMLYVETYRITLPKLQEMAEDFDNLNTLLVPLSWNIACLNPPKVPDESSPQEP